MALRPLETVDEVPALKDGRERPIGQGLRNWLNKHLGAHSRAIKTLALGHVIANPRYGTTVTPDLSQGAIQKITVTDGNAFTVAGPVNPTGLQSWTLTIVNSSGGAIGSVTFGSAIVQSGFSAPGNGHRTSAKFLLDGLQHVQVSGWATV